MNCEALRPDAKFGDLSAWLNSHLESFDELAVIVGHEPHLSALVSWLLSGSSTRPLVEMRKGGACLIEFRERVEKGRGVLKWLATPRLLKSVGSGK